MNNLCIRHFHFIFDSNASSRLIFIVVKLSATFYLFKEVAATRPTPKQQAGDESLDESSDSDIEYDPERETALLILRESIAYRVQRRRFEKQVLRGEEEEQAWRLVGTYFLNYSRYLPIY